MRRMKIQETPFSSILDIIHDHIGLFVKYVEYGSGGFVYSWSLNGALFLELPLINTIPDYSDAQD